MGSNMDMHSSSICYYYKLSCMSVHDCNLVTAQNITTGTTTNYMNYLSYSILALDCLQLSERLLCL